jgi:hypothetical protein
MIAFFRRGKFPFSNRVIFPLQAQCILFRRCPEVLAPFKYAGYPMLLQAVALPPDTQEASGTDHFLAEERTPQLQVPLPPLYLPTYILKLRIISHCHEERIGRTSQTLRLSWRFCWQVLMSHDPEADAHLGLKQRSA